MSGVPYSTSLIVEFKPETSASLEVWIVSAMYKKKIDIPTKPASVVKGKIKMLMKHPMHLPLSFNNAIQIFTCLRHQTRIMIVINVKIIIIRVIAFHLPWLLDSEVTLASMPPAEEAVDIAEVAASLCNIPALIADSKVARHMKSTKPIKQA